MTQLLSPNELPAQNVDRLPGTLSPTEAAEQLGISRSQVVRCLCQRKLAGIKVLERWLVYEHDLDRFRQEFLPGAGKTNIRRKTQSGAQG